VPADQSPSNQQKCRVNVSPLFVAKAQAAKLIKPSEDSFNYPSPSQPTAMLGVLLGQPRLAK
jgi:hypothetical protein